MNIRGFLLVISLLIPLTLIAQDNKLKLETSREMQAGRYGESINLLNGYISAHPQNSEGYNLRGLCYEKRGQYELAVYDFRSARKLNAIDKDILLNLSRATNAWYKYLYNKIEGYKREIALNPKSAGNYLEIGKCYKNLGEWNTAENWYDQFLHLEDPSSDEVIRYTEILAKNNHISKGIPLLKKYTSKFPQDHRLWSRYGYFLLWEGRINLAKDAFNTALKLRPYFKESMDGLDQAKGKGYIYTINDTSLFTKGKVKQKHREYAIDKYYKDLKKNPSDYSIRYLLIDELLKNSRIDEAYQQLLYMQKKEEGSSTRFQEKWDYLSHVRDSVYQSAVELYSAKFKADNRNRDVAIKLSDAYAHLFDYDNAISILESYLAFGIEDFDARFILAKYSAWSYQWDKAFDNMDILMKHNPDNREYQLLMAQLIAWNVQDSMVVSPLSYSKPQDIERAKTYLYNILKDDPHNITAILTLAFLNASIADFPESMKYIEMAKKIDPDNKEVQAVEDHYYTRIESNRLGKIQKLRTSAGILAKEGKCKEALNVYKELMSQVADPEKEILLEYAYFNNCALEYQTAAEIYQKLLEVEFDMEIATLRAKNILWSGDTLKAIQEFATLKEKEPLNYTVNLYLGELYERTNQFDKARDLYKNLLSASKENPGTLDSAQVAGFTTRLNYLKPNSGLKTFFAYIGISPLSTYYSDNQKFNYHSFGFRADIALFSAFSGGLSYSRQTLNNGKFSKDFSTFKGHLSCLVGNFYASIGVGNVRTINNNSKVSEFNTKYEVKDKLLLKLDYEKNDARVILYSPNILNNQLQAAIVRFYGSYTFSNNVILSSYFHNVKVSDGNIGNDLQLRAGKGFLSGLKIGYEYFYSNYSFSPEGYVDRTKTILYYAPSNFESHSLWGEYKALSDPSFKLSLGGKLGYVPQNDFLIREVNCELLYLPFSSISLSGKVTASFSSRFNAAYNYISAYLSAYLGIF